MNITIAFISPRTRPSTAAQLAGDYIARAARLLPCDERAFSNETAFLAWATKTSGRTTPTLILFDRLGQQLSSDQFAARLATLRDSGAQTVVLAIGPADGWSADVRARAHLLVSFGPITLPHELARVVLAEQTYRALTILAGHPYHSGH